METVDSNVIPDHSNMCNNKFEDDQTTDGNDEDEHVKVANLIANLKLDIDENKKIQNQLRKANATLTHELNERKSNLIESHGFEITVVPFIKKRASFVNPMYLKKAQFAKPCLYKVPYDKDDLVNIFAPYYDETLILKEESRSKLDKDLMKPYDYTYQNSLYEVPYDKDDLVNIFAPYYDETLILKEESRSKLDKDLMKPYDYTYQNSLYEFLNDVNARFKKPQVVPIRPRKPIRKTNQSVATPLKKIVTLDSTIQKSRSYYRKLYEKTFKIVQIILFIVDSGCTKHTTANLKLLCNFVEKYLGTVRFGNDQFALILGYGDLVQGKVTIKRVYYVDVLNYNLFSIGQFCDADMEVAFRKSLCYIRDLQGNDLVKGICGSDLYIISLQESSSPIPICFLAKASLTQAWLWPRRLSHLNFDTINLLSKNNIVHGLPKLKFLRDQLCSSCEMEVVESSSCNVDNLNMHTFYQRHQSDYRWTKNHPLEQVRRNPSKPVQTRRQLAIDPEMCMFALTVSTAEPINIKEEMADHTWIEQCRKNFISLTDSKSGN
nr:integrase, catalytic region, zinc finger, CCHC-type, peptidase aspartic, catalytic [Tanacetum cinerariifolium]